MEELNLETCLGSISGWCDDIHVLDSGSTDRTLDIANRHAHHTHFHPYVDHASQIDYAIRSLPFRFEWLLLLDADRTVTEDLKAGIESALMHHRSDENGFYVAHRNLFRGRRVRGLNSWRLVLFRRSLARVDDSELVDCRVRTPGVVGYLRGAIVEYNRKENDIDFWIDKHQRFASRLAAEEALRRVGRLRWSVKPRLFGNPDERIVWLKSRWLSMPLLVRPFLYFGYRFFLRFGFMDGVNGLTFHILQALWFRLIVDVKVMELLRRIHSGELLPEDLANSYRRPKQADLSGQDALPAR